MQRTTHRATLDLRRAAYLFVAFLSLVTAGISCSTPTQTPATQSPAATPTTSPPDPIGSALGSVGYPEVGGDTLTITRGTVAGFLDIGDGLGTAWMKTDAAINHGNSGGGSFDSNGRLVGIPTFRAQSETDALAYVLSLQAG